MERCWRTQKQGTNSDPVPAPETSIAKKKRKEEEKVSSLPIREKRLWGGRKGRKIFFIRLREREEANKQLICSVCTFIRSFSHDSCGQKEEELLNECNYKFIYVGTYTKELVASTPHKPIHVHLLYNRIMRHYCVDIAMLIMEIVNYVSSRIPYYRGTFDIAPNMTGFFTVSKYVNKYILIVEKWISPMTI